jgi:ATP-dependent DNA ligase
VAPPPAARHVGDAAGRVPPRTSRFGSPIVLSRVHWVRPELVAEVRFLTWTDENLLRQVVYERLREDKPVPEVRRSVSNGKGNTQQNPVRSY